MPETCDLFIIGAGSGGVRAARLAASYGKKVVVAEESRVGGTCVIRGCIPKKLFSYASHFHEDFEDASGFGWSFPQQPVFDWARLIENKDREIDRLNGIYKKLLADSHVTLIEKRAELVSAGEVRVGDRIYRPRHILLATGGRPVKPKIPGIEHAITSNEVFHLKDFPDRVVIVGGGYIAVEFAGIFSGLGAKVTQLYRGDAILRGFDRDVRVFLAEEMTKKGINIRTGMNVVSIEKNSDVVSLHLTDGSILECDCVLYATGRQPNTKDTGLEKAGIVLGSDGAIEVDPYSRTSQPHIYAVGDCTDRVNLTPVAIKEAVCFIETVYGNRPTSMEYENIASAIFSHPPVGTVGLSEEAARRKSEVEVYRTSFRPLKHTLTGRSEKTLMKLVVDKATRKVVGAHMVGADAPEIIQTLAIAVRMGATKEDFDRTVAVHPTSAEEFVTLRESVKP